MEEYVEVPSDSGITFNVKPKMKAVEIAEKARDAILSGKFQQVISLLIFCTLSLLTTWLAIMKNGSSCLDINSMMTITLFQVRVNLPNGDMVGHTGDIDATVVACKAADEAVKVRWLSVIINVFINKYALF